MTLTAAQLTVKVSADTSQAEKGLKGIGDEVHSSGGKLGNFLNIFGGMSLANIATNALQNSMGFLTGQFNDMISAGENANIIQGQTAAVIKSTGDVSGVTAKAVGDLATSMMNTTGINDDATQQAENMLLTFTNIHSNVFPATTKAVADMATAMNGGAIPSAQQMQDTAIQVGKALQDPVNGVTALQRVGVKLSDTQKEQVKHFMAVGDSASAQKVILGELNREFGGSATAAGKANGSMGIMKARLDEAKQSMGQALLPVIEKMQQTALPLITAALGKVSDALSWMSQHSDQLKPVAIALGAVLAVVVVGALASATVAAWSFTAALLANPMTWIAVGIIAAVAGIILVIRNWGAITAWLGGVWHAISGGVMTAVNAVWGVLKALGSFIGGAFSAAWTGLGNLVSGIWNGIGSVIKGAVNDIIGIIDFVISAIDRIHIDIPKVAGIGGGSIGFNIPLIPKLASGGLLAEGGVVQVGERGPELLSLPRGASVIPLSSSGSAGSVGGQTVQNITILLDGHVLTKTVLHHMANEVRVATGMRNW